MRNILLSILLFQFVVNLYFVSCAKSKLRKRTKHSYLNSKYTQQHINNKRSYNPAPTNLIENEQHLNSSKVYKSYQNGIYCNPSEAIAYPQNVKELLKLVNTAISKGETVKAIGNRLSLTDIICTDGLPISMLNINYTIDNEDDTATFGAGINIRDASLFLESRNKSLIHMPAFAGITIGGAIGTGAHGSSLLHPTSISDQVVRLKLIDGAGSIREISDKEELKALRVNLGLLGVIVDVTLQTVPLFKLTIHNKICEESILMDETAINWAKQSDWFEMWWFPSVKEVVVSQGNYTWDLNVPGNASTNMIPEMHPWALSAASEAYESLQATKNQIGLHALEEFTKLSLYSNVLGKPAIYSEDSGETLKNPATGIGWRLMSNICENKCVWNNEDIQSSVYPEESSVAFDLNELPKVVKTIKEVLEKATAVFSMIGVFIRFSKASDTLMGISSGRTTVTLEWTTPMRHNPYEEPKNGIAAYQAILQTMIHNHGGRPHWGKNGLYYFTNEVLEKSAPNRNKFIEYMRQYDPNKIYVNKLGKRILGISNEMDIDPKVTHCALQDYCVCKQKNDCALEQNCLQIYGFPVCS